ncbi:MAG: hypothetical protein O3A25_19125 [Acidobacteria bacterium]|nr:hypothetical protein [Acidobacteriota bacterium]
MAKVSGLGTRLYAAGYDLSSDVNALAGMGYTQAMLDVTTLDLAAVARIAGISDGTLSVNGWFEQAGQHAAWTSNSGKIPTADQIVIVQLGTALGDAMIGMVAKQATYGITRAPGSALATTAEYQSTGGVQLDFGIMLTTSKQTDASATASSGVDEAAATLVGAVAYLEVMSVGSGTAVVVVEDSANNSSWATIGTFTGATGQTSQRLAIGGTVRRYVRCSSTDTFTNAVFACGLARL